ncbi:hypothetical protein BV22DRAFT_1135147 [Leucogyrophana mollusca]|uniref:Uncharacterized protein n=1 Tax=Leucogyrophana mollusca TaxID=85980 RepID=A0ACB8AXI5_9AGAM|nr:hypothetical protein BV22DRAFT_1135147 [Leucogyrophana mollusca]
MPSAAELKAQMDKMQADYAAAVAAEEAERQRKAEEEARKAAEEAAKKAEEEARKAAEEAEAAGEEARQHQRALAIKVEQDTGAASSQAGNAGARSLKAGCFQPGEARAKRTRRKLEKREDESEDSEDAAGPSKKALGKRKRREETPEESEDEESVQHQVAELANVVDNVEGQLRNMRRDIASLHTLLQDVSHAVDPLYVVYFDGVLEEEEELSEEEVDVAEVAAEIVGLVAEVAEVAAEGLPQGYDEEESEE